MWCPSNTLRPPVWSSPSPPPTSRFGTSATRPSASARSREFPPLIMTVGKAIKSRSRDGGAFSNVGMDEGLVLSLCFTCRHVLKRAFELKSASWERYDRMFYGYFCQCAVNCRKSDFSHLFSNMFMFFLFSIPHQFLWAGGVR